MTTKLIIKLNQNCHQPKTLVFLRVFIYRHPAHQKTEKKKRDPSHLTPRLSNPFSPPKRTCRIIQNEQSVLFTFSFHQIKDNFVGCEKK